jgi:uncharacterized protein (DUF58 family)
VGSYFRTFLIFLLLLAIGLQETSLFTIVYLFIGVFLLGHWWRDQSLGALEFRRILIPRALLGENIIVRLEVANRGWLPVPWIRVHESLPVDLSVPNFYSRAISLPPKGKAVCEYVLHGNKRGYHRIGPVYLQSGDLFGLEEPRERQGGPDYVTVYPKIVPIKSCPVPSFSPLGVLRFHMPLFEDPSRTIGKRDYQMGDSLRRIDWKTSAAVGRLQVRKLESAISMEVVIFLNLHIQDFEKRSSIDAAELAIVTAASMAFYVSRKRQPVGLETNGHDPLEPENRLHSLPVRKGNPQMMSILEKLARLQLSDGVPLLTMLRERGSVQSWGTTLMVITGMPDVALFDEMLHARKLGLQCMIFLTAPILRFEPFENRARSLGIPLYEIRSENDLIQILM